jgi:hypothetical protein
MRNTKILVGLAAALAIGLCVPAAFASDTSLARTREGGCVLVDWTSNPYVVSPATGCSGSDPCVDVNWTTSPPEAAIGDC